MTDFEFLGQDDDIYFESVFDEPKSKFVYERRITNDEYIKRYLYKRIKSEKKISNQNQREEQFVEIKKEKQGFISQILYKFKIYFFG